MSDMKTSDFLHTNLRKQDTRQIKKDSQRLKTEVRHSYVFLQIVEIRKAVSVRSSLSSFS